MVLKVWDGSALVTLDGGGTEIRYVAGPGANRLAASFPPPVAGTAMYTYTVEVTSVWTDGQSLSSWLQAQVPIVDERWSRFGTGWTMVGLERVHAQSTGALVTDGAGGVLWFEKLGCSAPSVCTYRSPVGEQSTLQSHSGGWYQRLYADGRETHYHGTGYPAFYRDRFQNQTTFGYDPSLTLVQSITGPAGDVIQLGYHSSNWLRSITDPGGRISEFWYTGINLTHIHGPDGELALQPTYAPGARLNGWTDARGGRWDVGYDAASHRLAQIQAPVIGSVRQTTTVRSREASLLPLAGTGTAATPARRVTPDSVRTTVTGPNGTVTRIRTDAFGLATSIAGAEDSVAIGRNGRGQPRSTAAFRRVGTAWKANGPWTSHDYQPGAPHRLKTLRTGTPDGGVRYDYTYGAYGQVSEVLVNQDTEYRYVLDALGRTTHLIRGLADTLAWYGYDARGRLLSQKDAEGHTTTLSYLPSGSQNLWTIVNAGVTTQMRYDALGRRVRTVTAGVASDSLTYDVFNRVQNVRDRAGGTTTFSYGQNRVDLAAVTDARGATYGFSRNVLGMVTAEQQPAGDSIRTIYDPATLLPVAVYNRRNQLTSIQYDALRRPVVRTAVGDTTYWRYDPDGRWAVVQNAVSRDSMVYDGEGKLTETYVHRAGFQVSVRSGYAFPESGARRDTLTITGPWGASTNIFRYNSLGRLTGITDMSGRLTTLHYDREGMLDSLRLPTVPVARTRFVVDAAHRLRQAASTVPGLSHTYGFSSLGLTLRDSVSSGIGLHHQYTYDAMNRVSSWNLHQNVFERVCYTPRDCYNEVRDSIAQSRTFAWDAVGNPQGAVVQPGNRLVSHDGYTMEYDADGNLKRKWRTGFDQYLNWNGLGQLTGVGRTGVGWASYAYDGLGRRVRRVDNNNGAVTHYVYHDDDLVLELDGAGNRIREYSYLPGIDRPHAMRQWANGAGGAMYYYQLQSPGHVEALVDLSRNVVNQYRYTPFGTPVNGFPVEGTPNPLQYMARELDATTGLYYVRNRWYDPEMGRFISEDPIGLAGGINLYAYAENNPVSFTDPMGLLPCAWHWISAPGPIMGDFRTAVFSDGCLPGDPPTTFPGGIGARPGDRGSFGSGGGGETPVGSEVNWGLCTAAVGLLGLQALTDVLIVSGLGSAAGLGLRATIAGATASGYYWSGRPVLQAQVRGLLVDAVALEGRAVRNFYGATGFYGSGVVENALAQEGAGLGSFGWRDLVPGFATWEAYKDARNACSR